MNRKTFLKAAIRTIGGLAITALVGGKYVTDIEPLWFKVRQIELTLPKLPPAFKGFTLTHLTDLHLNDWMTPERFSKVVDMTNELGSDIIVITGDFIDRHTPEKMHAEIIEQLARLEAKQGVYGTLGNHDHWEGHRIVRGIMQESGIVDLCNTTQTFKKEEEILYLCGLDDYWERKQDLESVVAAVPEDACAILMMHEPDYADISATTNRFSLQLSGHSHGGQVDPLIIDQPILPTYGEKYPRGLYQVENMLLYTGTGIGMASTHVRLNCRPEIVQFTLV